MFRRGQSELNAKIFIVPRVHWGGIQRLAETARAPDRPGRAGGINDRRTSEQIANLTRSCSSRMHALHAGMAFH
eukprot:scaffold118993_cov32-Prasinocladus_malaysianus.AAC.1